ncbi:hypothetical protein ABZT06_17885 [Streptomyces sp. NPDC005483]|uniref:hypothetical protein n=1 Tax=Streptomyces sp. NPDC005483 TaxID=3154882 RepID=UPI0033A76DEE
MTAVRVSPFPAFPSGVTLTGSVYGALGAALAAGPVSAAAASAATSAATRRFLLCMVVPP